MKPRIGGDGWKQANPGKYGIYNDAYTINGHRYFGWTRPWTVIGYGTLRTFNTHTEAITYATTKAGQAA